MKKVLLILFSAILISCLLVGCGDYKAELSQTGTMYKSTTNKNSDGSNPTIIVESATKQGNDITVVTDTPFEELEYADKNFLAVTVLNTKGDKSEKNSVSVSNKDGQGIIKITPGSMKIEDIKYIQISPYQTESGDTIEFEVK